MVRHRDVERGAQHVLGSRCPAHGAIVGGAAVLGALAIDAVALGQKLAVQLGQHCVIGERPARNGGHAQATPQINPNDSSHHHELSRLNMSFCRNKGDKP